MRTLTKKESYCAPTAQVVEVEVERGFAATSNAPQWEEKPW